MPMLTPVELSARVLEMLKAVGAMHMMMQHEPEGRCIEVSALRGNNPHEAIKAMLLRIKLSKKNGYYALALLPGDSNMNFDALKIALNLPAGENVSVSMAAKQDVISILDSEPGAVSPFSFNATVRVLIDQELLKGPNVYFSAGRTDESVMMPTEEFFRVSKDRGAEILNFNSVVVVNSARQAPHAVLCRPISPDKTQPTPESTSIPVPISDCQN